MTSVKFSTTIFLLLKPCLSTLVTFSLKNSVCKFSPYNNNHFCSVCKKRHLWRCLWSALEEVTIECRAKGGVTFLRSFPLAPTWETCDKTFFREKESQDH